MARRYRFDLEKAVAAWRRGFAHRRVFLREDLDELERHLRDHVRHLRAEGRTEEDAFRRAVEVLGPFDDAEAEYRKVYWGKLRRRHELLHETLWRLAMLTNYLKIALRNLRRYAGYAFLNIAGLAVGLAAALLILVYVTYERSYDDFHVNKDRLFRIRVDVEFPDRPTARFAVAYPATGPALQRDFPEVESFARLARLFAEGRVMTYAPPGGDVVKQRVDHLYYADASFLTLFSYPLREGDPVAALEAPRSAVISASCAQRFFGDADPLGQSLTLDGGATFRITGVFEDVPENSHLAFDVLFSYATLHEWGSFTETSWGWWDFYTYVLLTPGADPAALQAKLPAFAERYRGEAMRHNNTQTRLYLQPVPDLHLHSDLSYEAKENGDATVVYFLIVIAMLVVGIAWVNYVNLSTARALDRAREVGMRKTLGAGRGQLFQQFVLESTLLNVLAAAIAIVLAIVALPFFSQFIGKPLRLSVLSGSTWSVVAGLYLFGGLAAGTYPALALSAFHPITVLKGRFSGSRRGARVRKGLVTFQVGIAVFLLVATAVVYRQVRYMQAQDLGFDAEQSLVLRSPTETDDAYADRLLRFKEDLLAYPAIRYVSAVSSIPGQKINSSNNFRLEEASAEGMTNLRRLWADAQMVDALGIELVAGRNFNPDLTGDSAAVLLNEAAVRYLGAADPEAVLGQYVTDGEDRFQVVGVIADYHQQPLRYEHDALIISYARAVRNYYVIRLQAEGVAARRLPSLLASIEQSWEAAFPHNLFDYFFLDDHFNAQYKAERRFGTVFALFAALALLVTCLGLFGLSTYSALQRTKEIGVRKVLGASSSNLLALLVKDFLKLVVAGFLLAVPIAYVVMQAWLTAFAYRVEISWPIFLMAGLTALLVAILTVSYQAIRAALADPVKALRYE